MITGRRAALPLAIAGVVAAIVILGIVLQPDSGNQGGATAPKPPDVRVAKTKLGRILVDRNGRTLYLFLEDHGGRSTCYDGCARVWPPALVTGKPKAGPGVHAARLTSHRRAHSNQRQLVYADHPLYTTVGDERPGQTEGQSFFGTWFVVSPSGHLIGKPSPGGGY